MQPQHPLKHYKNQAKILRAQLGAGMLTHAQALETVAKQNGFRNWNTLHGSLSDRAEMRSYRPGDRVRGAYLGHPFEGTVKSCATWGQDGQMRITIRFATPIDVVEFDSFSAFRQQVTAVLGKDGVSTRRTSKDVPHMVVAP